MTYSIRLFFMLLLLFAFSGCAAGNSGAVASPTPSVPYPLHKIYTGTLTSPPPTSTSSSATLDMTLSNITEDTQGNIQGIVSDVSVYPVKFNGTITRTGTITFLADVDLIGGWTAFNGSVQHGASISGTTSSMFPSCTWTVYASSHQ